MPVQRVLQGVVRWGGTQGCRGGTGRGGTVVWYPCYGTPAPLPLPGQQLPPPYQLLELTRPYLPVLARSGGRELRPARTHLQEHLRQGHLQLTPPADTSVHLNVKPGRVWPVCITESVRAVLTRVKLCGALGVVKHCLMLNKP